jgi:predicted RNase H-like nuclease
MQAVLGIDAAWTERQPSGVALAARSTEGWELIAVEASYQRFHARACKSIVPEIRPSGSKPSARELLASCQALCGHLPDIVAIDMPLSLTPIVGRRRSDDAVSRAYSSRKCATHTPSEDRPGKISDRLREGFEREGYPLLVDQISPPGLIEVYPHPALVELANAKERLPYKAAKTGIYWRGLGKDERRGQLYHQWRDIVRLLDCEIQGVNARFPELDSAASRSELKAFEDRLDAVICAWVAMCALNGRARPFGDQESAIWIPSRAGFMST